MISSRKSKSSNSGKSKPVQRRRGSSRQPEWDPTIQDLSSMRLSDREQAKRHAAHKSKNRVKLPDGHQNRQGPDSAAQFSQKDCPWHEVSQIDLGAVVRDLQAGKVDAEDESHKDIQPGADATSSASANAPADDVPNFGAEDRCKQAEQEAHAKAHDSDSSPSCKATPDSGLDNQQRQRQRAESALTSAPHPHSSSGRSAFQQPDAGTAMPQQDSHRAHKAPTHQVSLQQQTAKPCGSAAQSSSEQADLSQSSASAHSGAKQDSTGLQALCDSDQQLEAKLSALTDRLRAAEQAAGSHSQLQQQLQELKQDKDALQADMKQFTDHISTMLTTLQSQVSKLLLTNPKLNQLSQHAAVQSPADEDNPNYCRVVSAPLQWNVESHGMAPSPLACHQNFQSEAMDMPQAIYSQCDTTAGSLSLLSHAGSVNSQVSRQAVSCPLISQSAAAAAVLSASADDSIFDDEIGLQSFAQSAGDLSASQLPTADSQTPSPHLQSAQHASSAPHSAAPNAAQSQGTHPTQRQRGVSQRGDYTALKSPQLVQSHGLPSPASGDWVQQGVLQRFAGVYEQAGSATSDSLPVQSWGQIPLHDLPSQRSRLFPSAPQQSQRWHPPAVGLPDFGLGLSNDPQPSPLPQRLQGLENGQPNWVQQRQPEACVSGKQALQEVVMPQLRHRGLPHAPLPQSGGHQGPSGLRLKPMSVGQPPAAVVNKHDSLALSVWAAAQRSSQC